MNAEMAKAFVSHVFDLLEEYAGRRMLALMALHLVEGMILAALDTGLLEKLTERADALKKVEQ